MKSILSVLLTCAALNVGAQTAYPGNIAGCVARYDFSAGGAPILPDVSGNNNIGLTHNMTPAPGWRGVSGAAMQFDGQSSYANVASNALLTPSVITMVALVKFDGFYSGTCQGNIIVGKGVPPNGDPGNYTLQVHDQIYDQDCNAFNPNYEMPGGFLGNATYFGSVAQSTPIQPGRWYFLALSFDGINVRCYQVLMDSSAHQNAIQPIWTAAAPTNSIGINNDDLTIGKQVSTLYPYWFNGAMDEVAIFNRGLNDGELQSVYDYLWAQPTAVATVTAGTGGISAYSNDGAVHISSTDGRAIGEVSLYTIDGQAVTGATYIAATAIIDISGLPNQMLFARVLRNGVMSTIKVTNL